MAKVVAVKRSAVQSVTLELTATEAGVLLAVTERCNGLYLDLVYRALGELRADLPHYSYNGTTIDLYDKLAAENG